SAASGRGVSDADPRSKVVVVGRPPGWLSVSGTIESPAQRGIEYGVLWHALRLKGIALRKKLGERNGRSDLETVRFVGRPEIVPAQAERESEAASHAIGIRAVEAKVVFDEGARLWRTLRKGTAILIELVG